MRLDIGSTWDGQPAEPGERAFVEIAAVGEGIRVTVSAPDHGDPAPASPPGALWGLWEHEVVELFVLGPGDRYTELELGPHGHHLLLRLEGRRNAVARELPVDATWTRSAGRWTATTVLSADVLPPRPWRVNAYAIHGVGASRRYLAWAPVAGDKPDFHRLECFRAFDGG
jgi:hypothetical protein